MSDLAIAGHSERAGDEEQLVTMTVDGQLFGIPILKVQDIVEPKQITTVPMASAAVAGVLNLRGRIVTVIDLRVCLGAEPKDLTDRPMSVTVEHKGDLYTILVDSIGDVRSLPRNNLDKPPQTLDPRMRKLCSGVFRLKEDLLAVLDVDRVLDPSTIAEAPKRRPKPKRKPQAKPEAVRKSAAPTKSAAPASKDPAKTDQGPSLFERLGGELAIDAAVDLFYEKAGADPRLSPYFAGVDMGHQVSQMKAFLTQAFGGPANYKGADLRKAHQRLVHQDGLDDSHFIAVAGHLADTLNQMGVPEDLIDEVLTIAESVRDDVLDR